MDRDPMIAAVSRMLRRPLLPGVTAARDLSGTVGDADQSLIARRGRGADDDRGRGGNGHVGGNRAGNGRMGSGSRRSQPRVLRGSGCDDAVAIA